MNRTTIHCIHIWDCQKLILNNNSNHNIWGISILINFKIFSAFLLSYNQYWIKTAWVFLFSLLTFHHYNTWEDWFIMREMFLKNFGGLSLWLIVLIVLELVIRSHGRCQSRKHLILCPGIKEEKKNGQSCTIPLKCWFPLMALIGPSLKVPATAQCLAID